MAIRIVLNTVVIVSGLIEPKLNLGLARLVLALHKLVGKSMGVFPFPPALLPQIVC
jgi:hypothetical protein